MVNASVEVDGDEQAGLDQFQSHHDFESLDVSGLCGFSTDHSH